MRDSFFRFSFSAYSFPLFGLSYLFRLFLELLLPGLLFLAVGLWRGLFFRYHQRCREGRRGRLRLLCQL